MEIMASMGGFLMAVQLIFYWLSMFEETSFYVTMLLESFDDIKEFILMVFLCIGSFANAILILDSAGKSKALRGAEPPENPLID